VALWLAVFSAAAGLALTVLSELFLKLVKP
jgi:hypothetical protein